MKLENKITSLALDPVVNFGKVTVSAGHLNTDLVIGLNTNDGLKLPDTLAGKEFNLVWYNSTDYPDPADDPFVEIVRCTTRTVDTLTITRAQEGTAASNKNIVNKTYKMVLSPTKKTIDDIGTEYVKKAGDTMTSTLNLPSNGLIAGTNQFVLSGGNVGIGTPSPYNKLSVAGNILVGLDFGAATPPKVVHIQGGAYGDTTSVGQIEFSGGTGDNDYNCGHFINSRKTVSGGGGAPTLSIGEIKWTGSTFANAVTRITLDSSGNVGIGKTPAYRLEISTDSAGKPGATGHWTIVSDERIKKDITLADLDRCYEIIKEVPLKHFAWGDGVYTEEQVRDRSNLGWVSQDVQKVFPKATSVRPFTKANGDVIEDCLDLNQGQLTAALYGSVQKLMEKIEVLESEIIVLKDKVNGSSTV